MCGRGQYNIVKQLSSNKKKIQEQKELIEGYKASLLGNACFATQWSSWFIHCSVTSYTAWIWEGSEKCVTCLSWCLRGGKAVFRDTQVAPLGYVHPAQHLRRGPRPPRVHQWIHQVKMASNPPRWPHSKQLPGVSRPGRPEFWLICAE